VDLYLSIQNIKIRGSSFLLMRVYSAGKMDRRNSQFGPFNEDIVGGRFDSGLRPDGGRAKMGGTATHLEAKSTSVKYSI